MGTTISNTQIDKRKKLLDLPEDVITVLSVQAAKEGKSAKAFMEGLLISAANDLEDITTYTFLSKNQPEGLLPFSISPHHGHVLQQKEHPPLR